MKNVWVFILVWGFLSPNITFADDAGAETAGKREECRVCGMFIDQYLRTAAELTYKDGGKEHTCGVVCMFRVLEDEGLEAFSAITVHDFGTGDSADAHEAFYSIGSRVIPDMIPNLIAFKDRAAAEAFQAKEGGEVIDFDKAMQIVTPRGQTVPFRMQSAVTSPKGSLGIGLGLSYGLKDRIKLGSDSENPGDFISERAQQPRAPKEMESSGQALFVNYSVTDQLAVLLNLPYFKKQSSRYDKNLTTGAITTVDSDSSGVGDIDLRFRYNLWRSTFYDKWFTLLVAGTLPTGKFDTTFIDSPGLQIGAGAPSFTGGPLFSYNWREFWFHGSATYTARLENNDHYKYGNEVAGGMAIHYTPTYDYLIGVEADATYSEKNENREVKVGNTGGTRTNVTLVGDWRFLNALGGNFSLRAAIGMPIYENLNHQTVGVREQVQLGGGFFGNLAVSYASRFPFFE